MWRRSSVVRVVDELARAQRRERRAGRARGARWSGWRGRCGACASSWSWCSRSWRSQRAGRRACSATSAARRGRRCVVGGRAGGRPARRALLRLLHAMRVRRAWARATIDSGVAAGSVPVSGRVVGRLACRRAIVLRVRVRRGQSVAELDARREQLGGVPARARGPGAARSAGRGARRACCSCGAIRSRTRRRCAWPAADAEALSLWEPIPVGVDEQGERGGDRAGRAQRADRRRAGRRASRSRCRRCSPRRRSTRTRGSGCSTASSSSWRRGRRSRSGSPARTARRRSSCCARCGRRWTSAIASCSRAGCGRSAARTGCRCTWWCATSWRST